MEYHYTVYRSPIGAIYLLAGPKGLLAVTLNESYAQFSSRYQRLADGRWDKAEAKGHPVLGRAVQALSAYFDEGIPLPGDMPLDLAGTPFQLKVWKALRQIPHGKTVSYGDLARKIGKPGASRAVGGACGSNPLPLFIPCHRVLASDGSLGGFGGGLDVKEQLLVHEQIS